MSAYPEKINEAEINGYNANGYKAGEYDATVGPVNANTDNAEKGAYPGHEGMVAGPGKRIPRIPTHASAC